MTSIFCSARPSRGLDYRLRERDRTKTGSEASRDCPAGPAACRSVVRAEGLEPPQLSSLEPKSSASTNSATPAKEQVKQQAVRRRCRGRRAYNTQADDGSKKMTLPAGHTRRKMVGPSK